MRVEGSLILAGLLCASQMAGAQPASRLSLRWNAPVGCPSHDDVQARVDALLGGEANASSVSDVQASGQVQRLAAGFRLELSMTAADRPSSRVIDAANCDELAGAAAIAIALLARSSAAPPDSGDASFESGSSAAGSPAGDGSKPPAPQKPVTAPPPPASDSATLAEGAPPRGLHLVLDAPLAAANWGALPGAGLGIGAAAGLRWGALRFVAGGELWKPKTTELQGYSARFEHLSARAEACLAPATGVFELGACLGIAAERLTGEGLASATYAAKSTTSLWFSGTASIVATAPVPGLSALRVLGQAGVRVPTQRPRFLIDQLGVIHETALAEPTLLVGCEWIL
jgi:hypothetical protein